MLTLLAGCLVSFAPVPQADGERRAPEPMPTPRAVVLRRADDDTITVDGTLTDWPTLPAIRLDDTRLVSGTAFGVYTGPRDLSANAFMLWDDDFVYVALSVADDLHWKISEKTRQRTEFPPADAVVLTFDPLRDTRAIGTDIARSEDSSYWLSDVPGREIIRWNKLDGAVRIARGTCAVVRADENGMTAYEARIAWDDILPASMEPAAELVLDLQIVLDDYDVPDDPMPDTRIGWTFGTGARIDPGLFGSIRLSPHTEVDDEFQLTAFPKPPKGEGDPVPGPAHWLALQHELATLPPVVATVDHVEPEFAGGEKRKAWLERLDRRHAEFPRLDFLRYQMCIQRRMVREVVGMNATGLPFYWMHALRSTRRAAQADPPEDGYRLFRLPHGGWLVRSKVANFLIDPAGFAIERELEDYIDFVLLTSSADIMKRNDQLLVRLFTNRDEGTRPIFAHIAENIPGMTAKEFEVVSPGKRYHTHSLTIDVIGRTDERGWVTPTVGYLVRWRDGASLLVSGTDALSEDVPTADGKPDIAILSARHPRAHVFGHRVEAKVAVLDDVLQCTHQPGERGRIDLREAYTLQRRLRPHASLILAPSESLDSENVDGH